MDKPSWICACNITWTSPTKACPLCGNTHTTMMLARMDARRAPRIAPRVA